MSTDSLPPDFRAFTRWVAVSFGARVKKCQPSEHLLAAARAARDEARSTMHAAGPTRGPIEVLQLLAAASTDDAYGLPELTTPRGFRVVIAFDGAVGDSETSIGVLITCPPLLTNQVMSQTPYLWAGEERFAIGQFDADGKAYGTLPARAQITLSDFMLGKVKLEEPGPSADD